MKIAIEHEDMTSSVEFWDFDLHEFTDHLRGLLHTVWLPEQVNEIIPTEERISVELTEARKLGYDDGYAAGLEKAMENEQSTNEEEGE